VRVFPSALQGIFPAEKKPRVPGQVLVFKHPTFSRSAPPPNRTSRSVNYVRRQRSPDFCSGLPARGGGRGSDHSAYAATMTITCHFAPLSLPEMAIPSDTDPTGRGPVDTPPGGLHNKSMVGWTSQEIIHKQLKGEHKLGFLRTE